MTDGRLRDLERRSTETGAPADAARLLAERVRAGDVPLARVHLAAYCGDPAALLVTGAAPPTFDDAWLAGLASWGEAAVLALAVHAAQDVLSRLWDREDRRPATALEAVRRHLGGAPYGDGAEYFEAALAASTAAREREGGDIGLQHVRGRAARAAASAAYLALGVASRPGSRGHRAGLIGPSDAFVVSAIQHAALAEGSLAVVLAAAALELAAEVLDRPCALLRGA